VSRPMSSSSAEDGAAFFDVSRLATNAAIGSNRAERAVSLAQLLQLLVRLGFVANGPGDYRVTTRLSHARADRSSVFVGYGPDVTYGGQTTALARPNETFLIANGRGLPQGLARALRALGTPTGTIPDPQRRQPSTDDDPYWCGDDLAELVAQMPTAFHREPQREKLPGHPGGRLFATGGEIFTRPMALRPRRRRSRTRFTRA
jgi:hypothetical protein